MNTEAPRKLGYFSKGYLEAHGDLG